jgi:hypothetical protein
MVIRVADPSMSYETGHFTLDIIRDPNLFKSRLRRYIALHLIYAAFLNI